MAGTLLRFLDFGNFSCGFLRVVCTAHGCHKPAALPNLEEAAETSVGRHGLTCLSESYSLFRRFIDGGKSVPPTAFLGLIILWVGIEERSKILFLFLGAIFYMTLMTRNAVRSVRHEYVTIARDIGASESQIIFLVLIPGALPSIFDAVIVCTGLMWTYIVLAEWVNAQSGVGYMISIASRQSRSDIVYTGVIVIAAVSASTDLWLRWLRSRFFTWDEDPQE